MAKEKNIFDPEVLLSKTANARTKIIAVLKKRKSLVIGLVIIFAALFIYNKSLIRKDSAGSTNLPKTTTVKIDRSFDFPALNNQGKAGINKIRLKIVTTERTNQVLVNDKLFPAKNNKLFLILNIELKNDATQLFNIIPGDLIRLGIKGDEENKFAPDLHNNMVAVSAISTKFDRVGFVIPDDIREFKIYVGELEGKKETIDVSFPS